MQSMFTFATNLKDLKNLASYTNPFWFAYYRIIGTMPFFRMTNPTDFSLTMINHNTHIFSHFKHKVYV